MATPTVPNIFVPDTLADADLVNENFAFVLAQTQGGLNAFNVQNYGTDVGGGNDDTQAVQDCTEAAMASGQGNAIYFPTPRSGQYNVVQPSGQTGAIIIDTPNLLTFFGDGQSSVVSAAGDYDVFRVPPGASHGTGMTWMNMQIICATGNRKPNVSIAGSAINIGGPQGTYGANVPVVGVTDTRFYNITTQGVGIGLKLFAGGGRNVMYGCKFAGDYLGILEYGHGLKGLGNTINGGTYGLVSDGGADPKMFETPFFGCMSILSMNSSGSYKGGTFYMFDPEANFGPPPATQFTFAQGTYTLTLTALTGQTHTYTITGNAVVCSETTGTSAANQATLDAAAITTYFNTLSNFISNPGDYQAVTATANSNVVTITATEPGQGGNKLKTSATSGTGFTLTANQAQLSGGTDNGLWPGDATDYIGALANASGMTTGCGSAYFGGDHAQLNLEQAWFEGGTIIGDTSTTGPGFVDIVGGNLGGSAKGKSQATNYTIDIRNTGLCRIISGGLHQGGGVATPMVHIPTSAFVRNSIHINDNDVTVGNGNYFIQADDASATVTVCDNDIAMKNGTVAAGGQIQNGNTLATSGLGPTWVVRNNAGYNPTGICIGISTASWGGVTQTVQNTFGFDGFFVHSGGTSVNLGIVNNVSGGTNGLVASNNTIRCPAGGTVVYSYVVKPTSVQFFAE